MDAPAFGVGRGIARWHRRRMGFPTSTVRRDFISVILAFFVFGCGVFGCGDDSSSMDAEVGADARGGDGASADASLGDADLGDASPEDASSTSDAGDAGTDGSASDANLLLDSDTLDGQLTDAQAPDAQAPDAQTPDAQTPDAPTDSDTPDAGPPQPNYAFATSMTFTPGQFAQVDGATDGLHGADILCNMAARAGTLPGNYVAWLSTSTVHAIDRLRVARGWIRTDGTPFADTPEMLTMGANWFPLNHDEFGDPVRGLVVTGTGANGMASGTQCGDWASDETASTGGGAAEEMGRLWTSGKVPNCDGRFPVRIYCFGIDHSIEVLPPQMTGRQAFVTQANFDPSSGIDAADMLCTGEATTAELTGSFQALLAIDGASAFSRFTPSTDPWVRTDGIPLGLTEDILAGRLLTSISAHANGTTYSNAGFVFTGAATPSDSGDLASTCGNWMVTTGNARGGALLAPSSFFSGFSPQCSRPVPIYCLEE